MAASFLAANILYIYVMIHKVEANDQLSHERNIYSPIIFVYKSNASLLRSCLTPV